jgi:glycosyltransferase involved in cell wall biosynthesis
METPEISVVVLAYRGADTIDDFVASLVASLEKLNLLWEIVLVGNYFEGIGDRTPTVVTDIASSDSRILSITKVKKGMMGWDMKLGLDITSGKTIAVIDGDGQMPCEDVVRVYKLLKENNLDFVKTYRSTRYDGPYRKFISITYNLCFRFLFPGIDCRDINSKPKIMTRMLYEKLNLNSNGWFIDAEIMILVRRFKAMTGEVATKFTRIESRPSFVKPIAILEFSANLVWYRIKEYFV